MSSSPPTYPNDAVAAPPPNGSEQQPTSGLAIAGLVLAFVAPLIGLVVSIIAVVKTGAGKARGRGLAIAGVVISALGTLFWTAIIVAVVTGMSAYDDTTVIDSASDAEVVAEEAAPADEPAEAAAGQDAAVEPADAEVASVTEFAELSAENWEGLLRDPESRSGDGVVFYAEVFQYDTNTGTDAFLANAGPGQPAAEFELHDSVLVSLVGDSGTQIAEGDVLRVEGVVDGVLDYETLIGGNNSVPAVTAVTVEKVGYLDLTPDVALGEPVPAEYGGADVELTVTNSGDVQYTYSVDIVAESADGSTQYETAYASVDNLAPGQQATVSASFFDDLPEDAVLRVASVERYAS